MLAYMHAERPNVRMLGIIGYLSISSVSRRH